MNIFAHVPVCMCCSTCMMYMYIVYSEGADSVFPIRSFKVAMGEKM